MKKLLTPIFWVVLWTVIIIWAYTKRDTDKFLMILYGVIWVVSVVRLVIAIRNRDNDTPGDKPQF
jgi:hypothetical protein